MTRRNRRRVVWSEAATADLIEIVSFIAADSPKNADRLLSSLRTKAESLERQSQRGRVVPELAAAGTRTWRELLVKPYRILYRVHRDTVLVGALLDGRRNLEDLLFERITRIG